MGTKSTGTKNMGAKSMGTKNIGTNQTDKPAQIVGMVMLAAMILSIIVALGPSAVPEKGAVHGIDIMATDD